MESTQDNTPPTTAPRIDDIQKQITHIDRESAFLVFATFAGDAMRTAAALNVSATAVLYMADEGGWTDKLRGIIELKKSTKPGDWERAVNRAINFTNAHIMRTILERALRKFRDMDDKELTQTLVEEWTDREGNNRYKASGKAYSDLAAALEKVHAMSYHALNDTVQDRNRRKEQQDEDNPVTDMHAAIAAKMNEVAEDKSPRAQLFDAQIEAGNDAAEKTRVDAEVRAAVEDKVKPRWRSAVLAARDQFNKDPRMLPKSPKKVPSSAEADPS